MVDFCLTKNMAAAEDTNYPQLRLEWASRNQMVQRAGRAGRVGHDGRVYRLVTERFFQQLPDQHIPEMQRVPLSKVVLDVKLLDLGTPKELLALAMSPPKLTNLHWTVLELKEVGALLTTYMGSQDRGWRLNSAGRDCGAPSSRHQAWKAYRTWAHIQCARGQYHYSCRP